MSRVMFTLLVSLAVVLFAGTALAGANIPINDNASLNLGYRVQALLINTDANLDNEGGLDTYRYFKVRRGRLRLGAKVGDRMTAFLQTDASNKDVQLIDAFINFKVSPWLQFIMGRNMAPASRQNLTSSGALMAIDRPGLAYKSLTWGMRALNRFSNTTASGTAAGGVTGSPDAVRDNGLTIFGSNALGGGGLKYYVGMYNGIQAGVDDKDRFTFRAQYNLWDAEAAYFQSSTYLGKKKTLALGVSYDTQKEVAANTFEVDKPYADYTYTTVDVFLELPSSNGNALTVEAAWMNLDMNDTGDFMNTQGSGFYGQAGYYLNSGWQPWVCYETFDSDAIADADGKKTGKFTQFRVGLTYFLEGQHANIKLGYESYKADQPFAASATETADTINTITLGFYTTY